MRDLSFSVPGGLIRGKQSRADGTPVLLLHQNSGSAELFADLLAHAGLRDYRLIALDLPGHGESRDAAWLATDFCIRGLAKILTAIVRQLSPDRFAVLGHSLGGHVATTASEELTGLRALLLVSAPPLAPTRLPRIFKPDPTGGLLFRGSLPAAETERFARVVLGAELAATSTRRRFARIVAETEPTFREHLGASVAAGDLADERAILERAEIPIALMFGTEDPFHHLDYYKELRLRAASSRIVPFSGSGHCPHLDAPVRFAEAMRDFLQATL